MKAILLVSLVAAVALVPAFATLPVADACQPYQYYCPLGGWYYGCSGQIPGALVKCIQNAELGPLPLP